MATVRFSQELIDAILKNAGNKMHKPIEDAHNDVDPVWGTRIYNILFGEYQANIQKLPRFFFTYTDKINIRGVGEINCNIPFKFATALPYPTVFPDMQHAKGGERWNCDIDLLIRPDSPFQEFYELVNIRNTKIIKARERQTEFIAMVRKVIEAHATLAPALKMWSPLWDLIPEGYKERHRQVVEKFKSEVPVVDVDFSKMTAMATAAKLRG